MATKSIGSASRDYTTLSAWTSYVNMLSLSAPEVGEMYNDSEFSESGVVTIGGWSGGSSTNTVTLKCAAGQSFKDNANAQTNALRYNQSNGVGVKFTTQYIAPAFNFTSQWTIVDGIQWTVSTSNNEDLLVFNAPNQIFQNFIIQCKPRNINHFALSAGFVSPPVTFQNGLILITNTVGSGVALPQSGVGSAATIYDLTVVNSSGSGTGKGVNVNYASNPIVKNCAVYGFGSDYVGTCGTSANNATDKSSFGGTGWGTSGQTSITSAEWQSLSAGSEDLRLSTNSTKLRDNGAASGPSTDIVGTTRPQRAGYDIGCWELITFNPALVQTNNSGDNAMYIKNTAGQYLGFLLLNVNTGAPVTGLGSGVTVKRTIDGGAQANATGTVTEIGNGQYSLALSQADTNGDDISFLFSATDAVSVEKSIVTQTIGADSLVALPMMEYKVGGTYTPSIPSNCIAIQAGVLGGGGGGAGTSSAGKVSGGGGGAYGEFMRPPTSGATTLTIIIGASAAGGTSAAGTAGNASSISDGTWTVSCPGGAAGSTAGTAATGGTGPTISGAGILYSISSSGGASGAVSTVGGSGGGAGGNPLGTGGAGGAVTNPSGGSASGGGGLRGNGGATSQSAATGGGGTLYNGAQITSGNFGSGGGGSGGAAPINTVTPGQGGGGGDAGSGPLIYRAAYAAGAGGAGNVSGNGSDAQPGGGGGGAENTGGGGLGGNGGLGGGGGGCNLNGSGFGGNGGAFGGGGAAGGPSVVGGNGGLGGGGGGGISATLATGGSGGCGYAWVVFWVRG